MNNSLQTNINMKTERNFVILFIWRSQCFPTLEVFKNVKYDDVYYVLSMNSSSLMNSRIIQSLLQIISIKYFASTFSKIYEFILLPNFFFPPFQVKSFDSIAQHTIDLLTEKALCWENIVYRYIKAVHRNLLIWPRNCCVIYFAYVSFYPPQLNLPPPFSRGHLFFNFNYFVRLYVSASAYVWYKLRCPNIFDDRMNLTN